MAGGVIFFISWGSRVLQRIFGEPEQHYCDICREERTFRKMVTYKVMHIWWIFRWVAEGRLAPAIDEVLPFTRAGEALERLEQRKVKGKLVLVPG